MCFSPPYSIRGYLYDKGWKRGAFLEVDDNHHLISQLPLAHRIKILNEECMVLVTLYDCALIHGSFDAEPDVGYAVVKPIDSVNKAVANAKNERILHYTAEGGNEGGSFEIRAGDLGFFNRELLLHAKPSARFQTTKSEQQVVGKWISRRVTQPTYPDSFNNRVNKSKKEDLFKKRSKDIAAFYIRISPADGELESGETYQASIIAAVEDSKIREAKKNKLDDTIRAQLKLALPATNGIELSSFEMMAESQITLGMLRDYVQWADEYFSFRNNPYSSLPVELQ